MFALCHFKENKDKVFILWDKEDIKEIAECFNIEISNEIAFEQVDKDYSLYPILSADDLLLRALNKKARTMTHVLDEIGISCWDQIRKEYDKIKEKKSQLSKSQRDKVVTYYERLTNLNS